MPIRLTSPSGVAGPRGTPCPRSRDGLPDRDDVPDDVRRVPAQWVRPRRPRLDPPSVGIPLVSWVGTGAANSERKDEAPLEEVSR